MPSCFDQFGLYRSCEYCLFADECEYEDLSMWDDYDDIYMNTEKITMIEGG